MEKSPFFKFERPLAVYAELYNQGLADSQKVGASYNLATTLVVAFFVIVGASFFLRGVEYYLQPPSSIISLPPESVSEEKAMILPDFFRLPSVEVPGSVKEHIAEAGRWVLGIENVQAAEFDYVAQKYSQIKEIEMTVGERRKIKIGFDNLGRYNWRRDGRNFISVYTDKPHYSSSPFYDKSWLAKDQPAKMFDSLVGPGSRGYFEFYLQAPKKPGIYHGFFALAAENKAWLKGGSFELVITVKEKEMSQVLENIESPSEPTILPAPAIKKLNPNDFFARRLSLIEPLNLLPGETREVRVMFLNQGKKSWLKRQLVLEQIKSDLSKTEVSFTTPNWESASVVMTAQGSEIKHGQTEIYPISLSAPDQPGIYNLNFKLLINDGLIEGGSFFLPVLVGAAGDLSAIESANEPFIRVGLFTTEEPVKVQSPFSYRLKNIEGNDYGLIEAGQIITLAYQSKEKIYQARWQEQEIVSAAPLRLEPVEADIYFVITNYENRPRWNKKVNDNEFRGALEMSLSQTGYVWMINELPLESYLKGLAEVAENSPVELQKAVLIAARSYAYYHLKQGDKHEKANFHLEAAIDQVYRGYGQEKRSPKLTAAVEATTGLMVTYQGEVVPAPYFTRSNGHTRTWKEAWGGQDKPWLKSVKTPYDKGYSRLGHGVGMSLHDATRRAQKGVLYEDILKYYYTGVEVMKGY